MDLNPEFRNSVLVRLAKFLFSCKQSAIPSVRRRGGDLKVTKDFANSLRVKENSDPSRDGLVRLAKSNYFFLKQFQCRFPTEVGSTAESCKVLEQIPCYKSKRYCQGQLILRNNSRLCT